MIAVFGQSGEPSSSIFIACGWLSTSRPMCFIASSRSPVVGGASNRSRQYRERRCSSRPMCQMNASGLGDRSAHRTPGLLEHPVPARRAHRHHVRVQHHERQAAVTLQRIRRSNSRIAAFSHASSQWSRGTQALCSFAFPWQNAAIESPLPRCSRTSRRHRSAATLAVLMPDHHADATSRRIDAVRSADTKKRTAPEVHADAPPQ